MRHNYKVLSYI